MAFFLGKNKSAQYSFVLPTSIAPVYSGTLSFFKDSHVLLKVVVFQIQVIPFISLALSVIVPILPVHCIMLFNQALANHTWPLTEMSLDYRLQIFWLKLKTSLARSFVHPSKNTFSPSLLFFKIYFS